MIPNFMDPLRDWHHQVVMQELEQAKSEIESLKSSREADRRELDTLRNSVDVPHVVRRELAEVKLEVESLRQELAVARKERDEARADLEAARDALEEWR
jgi:chromosome segregation ATPase